jgi:hypothetical protein
MKEKEELKQAIDGCITDACNRYLNALEDIGVVDKRARAKKNDAILKIRNDLLDEYMPWYVKRIAMTMKDGKSGEHAIGA